MKRYIFLFLVCFFSINNHLEAQRVMRGLKKNALTISPLHLMTQQKSVHFGYERRLGKRVSLLGEFGILGNQDELNWTAYAKQNTMTSTINCTCQYTLFLLYLPLCESNGNDKVPDSFRQQETRRTGGTFFTSSFKFYLIKQKKKGPTGLYIRPSLTIEKTKLIHYEHTETYALTRWDTTHQVSSGLPLIAWETEYTIEKEVSHTDDLIVVKEQVTSFRAGLHTGWQWVAKSGLAFTFDAGILLPNQLRDEVDGRVDISLGYWF